MPTPQARATAAFHAFLATEEAAGRVDGTTAAGLRALFRGAIECELVAADREAIVIAGSFELLLDAISSQRTRQRQPSTN